MKAAQENIIYRKTELKIIEALIKSFQNNHLVNLKLYKALAENGIPRTSFYLHYKSLSELINKNEEFILNGIHLEVDKKLKNNLTLERFYRNVLLFIYKNREKFALAIESKSIHLEMEMMKCIKPVISEYWNDYGESLNRYLFQHLTAAFAGEMRNWHDREYNPADIERRISNLTKLTYLIPRTYGPMYIKH